MCGKVFCWQCSNNWLLFAAANGKKKERCCNQCYIENSYNNIPDSINSSTITNENSVDSVTLPSDIRSSLSLDSDMSSPQGTYHLLPFLHLCLHANVDE